MQNREELRQKGLAGGQKTTCHERGTKIWTPDWKREPELDIPDAQLHLHDVLLFYKVKVGQL